MSTPAAPAALRSRAALLLLGLLPVLAFVAVRYLGLGKLARLGGFAGAAVVAATAVFLRPRWGLYFLLFYIYSGVALFLPINLAAPTLAVIIVAVLLQWVRGEDLVLPGALFGTALGLFVVISLQSMLVARDVAGSLFEVVSLAKNVLIVAAIVHLIRTPDHLRRLCYVVFAGAVCTVALGVIGITAGLEGTRENYIGGVYVMRFAGAHENPNKAAAYMCAALPLGVFAARHCRHRLGRLAFAIGIVVTVIGIFVTFSRGIIVSLAIVVLGVAAHELRSRRSLAAVGVLLTAGVLLAPRYYWQRVTALPGAILDTTQDWSVHTRMLAHRTAWEMFLDHPITGVGLGNFVGSSAYRLFVRIGVHNTYLEILVETGIAGLFAFLAMLGAGLRHTVAGARRRWEVHPAWMRSLSFYVALSAASIGVSAALTSMPFRYPLWVPAAAGLVIGNLLRAEKRA